MGWGSGTALHPYLISPLSAIQHEAITQRIAVDWMLDNSPSAIKLAQLKAKRAQVVIVCVSAPVSSIEAFSDIPDTLKERRRIHQCQGCVLL